MRNKTVFDEGVELLANLKLDPENKSIWFQGIFNQWFRLNTLYDIKDRFGKQVQFRPNLEQTKYYENSHDRDLILKARQLGFTTFKQILELDNCLFIENYSAACIAQNLEAVKDIFDNKVKFAYENMDHGLIEWITDGRFRLPVPESDKANAYKFDNGSKFSVGTGYRGGTLQSLHVSEFGKICKERPEKAKEIITGSVEAVAIGGSVVFESTAEGQQGYFFDYCQKAQSKTNHSPLEYKLHFFAWWQNPTYTLDDGDISPYLISYFNELSAKYGITLTDGQRRWYSAKAEALGDDIFREYPSTIDEPFKVSIEGAYYARQFAKVYKEKRIGEPLNDFTDGVCTSWDIGTGDSTSIWFYRRVGNEIHVIDFYENNGYGLDHYMKVVHDKPYKYLQHNGPHDMDHRQFGNKAKTLRQLAKEGQQCDEDGSNGPTYKLDFHIVPQLGINDGIALVRDVLSRCYFYQVNTERMDDEQKKKTINHGVTCLESYRKEWDKKNSCWRDNPLHDWSSHAADAFRYLAVTENKKKQVTILTNNIF